MRIANPLYKTLAGATLVTLLLAGYAPESQAQNKENTLLLGFNNYHSVLLQFSGTKLVDSLHLHCLATPQPNGWRYFKNTTLQYQEGVSDTFYNTNENGEIVDSNDYFIENGTLFTRIRPKVAASRAPSEFALTGERESNEDTTEHNETSWEDYRSEGIGFIGQNTITIALDGGGYTGGAHPYQYNGTPTYMFSDLLEFNDAEVALEEDEKYVAQVTFDAAEYFTEKEIREVKEQLWIRAAKGYIDDGFYDEVDLPSPDHYYDRVKASPDDTFTPFLYFDTSNLSYDIIRHQGQWVVRASAFADASYAESGDYSLTVSALVGPAPKVIVPYNRFPADYVKMRKEFKKMGLQLNDASLSPDKSLLMAQVTSLENSSAHSIRIYSWPEQKELLKLEYPTVPNEGVPSLAVIEWAQGKYAAQWLETMRQQKQ